MGQTKTEIKQKTQLTFAERLGQEEVENAEANMFRMNEFGGEAEANRLIEKYRAETELTEEEENALIENVPVAPNFTVYTKEEYDSKWNCNKRRYRKKVIKYFDDRRKYYTKKNTGKESGTRTKGQIFARTRRAIEKRIKNKNAGDTSIIEDASFIQEKDNNLILEEKPKADKKRPEKRLESVRKSRA